MLHYGCFKNENLYYVFVMGRGHRSLLEPEQAQPVPLALLPPSNDLHNCDDSFEQSFLPCSWGFGEGKVNSGIVFFIKIMQHCDCCYHEECSFSRMHETLNLIFDVLVMHMCFKSRQVLRQHLDDASTTAKRHVRTAKTRSPYTWYNQVWWKGKSIKHNYES